jgi:hypothetical protein
LVDDVNGDEDKPIALDDADLIRVMAAAATELRRRMPRYAFEQGDLDFADTKAVAQMESAEDACDAAEQVQETWGVTSTP